MFLCKFCEIPKNTFFYRRPLVSCSVTYTGLAIFEDWLIFVWQFIHVSVFFHVSKKIVIGKGVRSKIGLNFSSGFVNLTIYPSKFILYNPSFHKSIFQGYSRSFMVPEVSKLSFYFLLKQWLKHSAWLHEYNVLHIEIFENFSLLYNYIMFWYMSNYIWFVSIVLASMLNEISSSYF